MSWTQAIRDCDAKIAEEEEKLKKARTRIRQLKGARMLFSERLASGEPWPGEDRAPQSAGSSNDSPQGRKSKSPSEKS